MIFFYLSLSLYACVHRDFESDKRQIIAKDIIRQRLHRDRSFDITGFKEDTLQSWPDSAFQHPLRYILDFVYNDSTNTPQKKEGVVVFAPEGHTVLNVQINDRP